MPFKKSWHPSKEKKSIGSAPLKRENTFFSFSTLDRQWKYAQSGWHAKRITLPLEVKHLLLLSKDNPVTRLLIKHCHEIVAHQGRGITIKNLRNVGFWIIGCRTAVSSFLLQCIKCRHLQGKALPQRIADLPEEHLPLHSVEWTVSAHFSSRRVEMLPKNIVLSSPV